MNRTTIASLCAAAAAFAIFALAVSSEPSHASQPAAPVPATVRPTPSATLRPTQARPVMMPTPLASPYANPAGATGAPAPSPTMLTLMQAEDIALSQSPALAFARAQVEQFQAGIGVAESAEFPTIDASGSTTRTKTTFRSTGGSFPLVITSNSGAINFKQLILDGGHVSALAQAARYSTDSAKLTLIRDIQTTLLTVVQQYYGALQARHQFQAAQQSLSVAQVQYNLVQAQYRAGVASKADVLTAQLPVAQAELTLATAQNGEATNVASLLTTMGLPANVGVLLQDDTSVSSSSANVTDAISTGLSQRPDLAAAKASVSSSQASLRAANIAGFPNVSGTATSGTSSTNLTGGAYQPQWSLSAGVSFPLYSGGLLRAQSVQAKALEQQAQANYRTAELNVYLNVQQAYLGLLTDQSSLNAAKVALDQARVVVNVTNAQYKAGVTTLPLLLNAQSQFTTAQSNYVTALYTYKIAQQNLTYAEGTLTP